MYFIVIYIFSLNITMDKDQDLFDYFETGISHQLHDMDISICVLFF